MPTSSQAMILRCNESPHRRPFQSKTSSSSSDSGVNETVHLVDSKTKGSCGELVKFDFSVSATPDTNLSGFEGVFAYDEKKKSYRWQIFSVTPKRHENVKTGSCKQPDCYNHDGGDLCNDVNEDSLPKMSFEGHGSGMEGTPSFIESLPSDHTKHFTTPTVSRMENGTCSVSLAAGLESKSPRLSSVIIPPQADNLDNKTYRKLEELGFRRQTTYSPSGALVRMRPKKSNSPKSRSPRGCQSEVIRTSDGLSINNIDPPIAPIQRTVPFKSQAFHPNTVIKGESMRKRLPATKQKSLLEEVKESVNWDERSTPTIPFRRGRPNSMPTTVCFSKEDAGEFSHQDVLETIREQIDGNVKQLQFDAASVRTPEFRHEDRWIVTFASSASCEMAVTKGIALGGEMMTVKPYDDVIKEEFISEDTAWEFPCNFRLQSEKHKYVLKKFLNIHKQAIIA